VRPQKAYRRVMAAFEFWYKDKDTKMLYAAIPAVKKLIEKDKAYWTIHQEIDEWFHTYVEPDTSKYDYSDKESVGLELMYISDRFNSTSRLSWLYHGLITKQI